MVDAFALLLPEACSAADSLSTCSCGMPAVQLVHDVERRGGDRRLRRSETAVPRHAGVDLRRVRVVHPYRAAAAAETSDGHLVRVRTVVLSRPGDDRVEVLERLLVGELVGAGDHLLQVLHLPQLADAEVGLVAD